MHGFQLALTTLLALYSLQIACPVDQLDQTGLRPTAEEPRDDENRRGQEALGTT